MDRHLSLILGHPLSPAIAAAGMPDMAEARLAAEDGDSGRWPPRPRRARIVRGRSARPNVRRAAFRAAAARPAAPVSGGEAGT